MHLTIAYSKIKKQNLVSINNAKYQRETLSERPIRQPVIIKIVTHGMILVHTKFIHIKFKLQIDLWL